MRGEGVVLSVSDGEAVVRISKSSACGHDCASCGACSNPTYEIRVSDSVGAKTGDRVEIESDTAGIMGVSFLLYILPVFILIISALVCEALSLGLSSAVIYVPLLALWFIIIKTVNKKAKLHNTIVRIIDCPQKD